jgi:hypothetical protein
MLLWSWFLIKGLFFQRNKFTVDGELAKAIDHKNIRMYGYIYHLLKENEDLTNLKNAKDYLVYCEVAERKSLHLLEKMEEISGPFRTNKFPFTYNAIRFLFIYIP